jgi:hypothetical protein
MLYHTSLSFQLQVLAVTGIHRRYIGVPHMHTVACSILCGLFLEEKSHGCMNSFERNSVQKETHNECKDAENMHGEE